MSFESLMRHRSELLRAVRNNKYEVDAAGGRVLVPSMGLFVGGVYEVAVNDTPPDICPNLFPTEGLNHLLTVLFAGTSQVATWYFAPFKGNVTPAAAWTAANFNSTYAAQELTAAEYDEGVRQTFVDGAAAAGVISNSASKAVFTSTGAVTIRGICCLSIATVESTSGTLVSAARLPSDKTLAATETLTVQLTVTASNAA